MEYVDEIFNPHLHIPHMLIIRIFRIRMANPKKTLFKNMARRVFDEEKEYEWPNVTNKKLECQKPISNVEKVDSVGGGLY